MSTFVRAQHRMDLSPYDNMNAGLGLGVTSFNGSRAESYDVFQSLNFDNPRETISGAASPIFKSDKKGSALRNNIFYRRNQLGYEQENRSNFLRTPNANATGNQFTSSALRGSRTNLDDQSIFSPYSQQMNTTSNVASNMYTRSRINLSPSQHDENAIPSRDLFHTPQKKKYSTNFEETDLPALEIDENSITYSNGNVDLKRQRQKRLTVQTHDLDTYKPSVYEVAKSRSATKKGATTATRTPTDEQQSYFDSDYSYINKGSRDNLLNSPLLVTLKKSPEPILDNTSYNNYQDDKFSHTDFRYGEDQFSDSKLNGNNGAAYGSRARYNSSVNNASNINGNGRSHTLLEALHHPTAKKKEWNRLNEFDSDLNATTSILQDNTMNGGAAYSNYRTTIKKRNEDIRTGRASAMQVRNNERQSNISSGINHSNSQQQFNDPDLLDQFTTSSISIANNYTSGTNMNGISDIHARSRTNGLLSGQGYDLYSQTPTRSIDFGEQSISKIRGTSGRRREAKSVTNRFGGGGSMNNNDEDASLEAIRTQNSNYHRNEVLNHNNSRSNMHNNNSNFDEQIPESALDNSMDERGDSRLLTNSSKNNDRALTQPQRTVPSRRKKNGTSLDYGMYLYNNDLSVNDQQVASPEFSLDTPMKESRLASGSRFGNDFNQDNGSRRDSSVRENPRDYANKNEDRKSYARSVIGSRGRSNSIATPSDATNTQQSNIRGNRLAKNTIRISVLGGGETIEVQDFSLKPSVGSRVHLTEFEEDSVIRINFKNILEIENYMEEISMHLSQSSFSYMASAKSFLQLIYEDPRFNINQVYVNKHILRNNTFNDIGFIYKKQQRFFNDEKLCRVGKILNVLELVSVYLIIELGKSKRSQIQSYYPQMKSLIYYTHQSFLMFWDMLYHLFAQSIQDKDCLERLRQRIEEKRHVKIGSKRSSYLQLKQNYDILTKLIQPLIKDVREVSIQLQQLFKVCEDQSTVQIFNSIRNIFDNQIQLPTEELDISQYQETDNEQIRGTTISANERMVGHLSVPSNKGVVRNVRPYLPPPDSTTKPFTLVLDLDETLIHFFEEKNGGSFLTRPFCDKFLREMSRYYELVIFTAGTEEYANWVLNNLDKSQYIKYRLYRQHTNFNNGVYVKDLSKIGRDISKSIIVDNVPENFRLQKDNGIGIKSWYNDRSDTALRDLIPILTELATTTHDDVRPQLKRLRARYPPQKVKFLFDLPL